MSKCLIGLLACALLAQSPTPATHQFNVSVNATGPTASSLSNSQYHTVEVVVVSPATCSIQLEGSLDNATWANLSGSQSCTTSTMFHVDGKSVTYVRANLTAYSGDAGGAVVKIYYKGQN
jgi:hypothetical protein